MSVDKNQAMIDFLIQYESLRNHPLFFNFINAKDDSKQLITVSNDTYLNKPYIDGSVLRRYSCTLVDFKSISDMAIVFQLTDYANENIEEMSEVQDVIDWIHEQNELQNYPNFGTDCVIQEMTTTADNPTLEAINEEEHLAMYSVTIQVDYIDNSKKLWR